MSCSACAKRRQGRIVPVIKPKPQGGQTQSTAAQKGAAVREKLRYTGR